jgi:putative sigma-54 modulation protein
MKVNAQSVNFNADGKLIDFVQNRLDKLETFYDKVISADVHLKVENTSSKENKIVEIKLNIPKDKFVVKKQCKSFEEAIDSSCSSLERKLIKIKEKQRVKV